MRLTIINRVYDELAKVDLSVGTNVPQLLQVIFQEINRQEAENDSRTKT